MDQTIARDSATPPAQINAIGRLFLLIGGGLAALAVIAVMPILPAIEATFHDIPNAATLTRSLMSSLSIAMIIGSFIAAFISSRFGLRAVILVALTAYGIAGTAGFYLDSLGLLLASRFVLGICASLIHTLIMTYLAVTFVAAERDRWIGWIAASGTICSLIIVPLAGMIGNIGWRYVFLLYLVAFPLILMVAAGIRKTPRPPESAATAAPKAPLPGKVWLTLLLAICTGAVVNTVPMFLPFYLVEIGQTQPSRIANAMLCSTLAGAAVALLYGNIRQWLTPTQVFAIGFVVGGSGLLLASQTASYPVILAALTLNGLGIGLTMPNLSAFAASLSPAGQSGKVIGLTISSYFLGGPVSQFVMEFLVAGKPAQLPIMILSCAALGLGVVWFLLQPLFRQPEGCASAI